MSRIRRTAAAAVVAGMMGGVAPLAAQTPRLERELVQHLDTLIPILRQARLEAQRAGAVRDSLRRAQPTEAQDTMRIGLARVVTFPDQVATANQVLGAVWSELNGMVKQSPAMERFTFSFYWSARRRTVVVEDPSRRVEAPAWRPRSVLEDNAREAIGAVLAEDLRGTKVGVWVRGSVRAPLEPVAVYRQLLTMASKATRACVRGDAAACWTALGSDDRDDILEAWYTPAERVARALQSRGSWFSAPTRNALERCAVEGPQGDVSQCDNFLGRVSGDVAAPLTNEARRSLLWVALTEGGLGSFDRLVADPEMAPGDALQSASGLTSQELAARWLAWVNANRPAVYSGLGTTRWVAFFWFLFFGVLALRSTRWRSG